MRWCAGFVSLLAVVIVLLPQLGAQDKKDPPKGAGIDAKDPDKKEPKGDDDKKDEDKAKKKEPAKKVPEVVYGQTVKAKLVRMDANSARDFAIEVPQIDPKKVNDLDNWQMNEIIRISAIQKPQDRARDMAQFQLQYALKQNNDIYTLKEVKLRAAEDCKVRTLFPPVEYDDKGRQRILTKKDLAALKGGSKLPGYPADFDRLAAGQFVAVYFAKTKAAAKKDSASTKKKNVEFDAMNIPEVVMIVVEQDAPTQK